MSFWKIDPMESRILYENGPFYAYQARPGGTIEIRKNTASYAVLIGTCGTKEHAIRFIDRACIHPEKIK